MARVGRVLKIAALEVALVALLLEVAIRLLHAHSETLQARLYIPPRGHDYSQVDSVEELLDLTVLGFSPYREYAGFIFNSRGFRTPEYEARRAPGT